MAQLKAEWLQSPIVREVTLALGADQIMFVGGAVRDSLIGRPVNDIDAATKHKPEITKKLLERAGIKCIPTGLKHGTVTAVLGSEVMEITTLRIDVQTDGRHAEVAFTEDWLEDARRRDFTFNALYASPVGDIFDPFGGVDDLQEGTVRFIGDAKARIEEDALRILRFFRFYARYGKGTPDPEAMAACRVKTNMLAHLSAERIRDELMKLVAVDAPEAALHAMKAAGVLEALLGAEATLTPLLAYLDAEVQAGVDSINKLARFYFLVSPAIAAKEISARFRLSNRESKWMQQLDQLLKSEDTAKCVKAIHRQIYSYGREAVITALIKSRADGGLLQEAGQWAVPSLPVTGKDLKATGVAPGKLMGEALKKLEAFWIESDFQLTKHDLLERLNSQM